MGQQQLLLLVLGIVIVGLAVVVGVQAFDENSGKAKHDREQLKIVEYASRAQAWKIAPSAMGGGAGSAESNFSAFTVRAIGLTATGTHGSLEYVDVVGSGCFKFFPSTESLRINALNENCSSGSWTKGILITGIGPEDLTWDYR